MPQLVTHAAGRRDCRPVAYFCALTMAKAAPWGSRAWTIHAPPGTSAVPCRIYAPRSERDRPMMKACAQVSVPIWKYYIAVESVAEAAPQGAPPVAKVW
jgi:hypothetical protein